MDLSYQYVVQCRFNTLNQITPANSEYYDLREYKALVDIGKEYIRTYGLKEFTNFFQGDQYFVELWTAHIIFEYGNPEPHLRNLCVDIIEKYSDNPLAEKVASEERVWLKEHII